MKLYGPLLLVFSLVAADVWDKKPFTDWSPKDGDHMLTSSPWARETTAAFAGGAGAGGMGSGGGRGGSRGGGRGGGGGGMGGGGAPGGGGAAAPQTVVLVSLAECPTGKVKEALVRGKFGVEAATAAEAKSVLANEEAYYVIAVERLPRMGMGRPGTEGKGAEGKGGEGGLERMRQMMARSTSLLRKGKEPIKPGDVKMATLEKTMTVYFIFPRTEAITIEDKEVEFSSTNTVDFPVEGPGIWKLKLVRRGTAITVWVAKDGGPLRELGHTVLLSDVTVEQLPASVPATKRL